MYAVAVMLVANGQGEMAVSKPSANAANNGASLFERFHLGNPCDLPISERHQFSSSIPALNFSSLPAFMNAKSVSSCILPV